MSAAHYCAGAVLASILAAAPIVAQPVATEQESGATALLQAISVVDRDLVWVSGHEGVWGLTTDGGATWRTSVLVGHEELQLRDVDALDARNAWLMSAGSGPLSRIFRTTDGGANWTEQYVADHPDAFLDCMAFWDADRGIAYGDAVDGVLFILRTTDGGSTWTRVPPESLPDAQAGEGGFAASGTCATTAPGGTAWLAAGNAERARAFRSDDYGASWTALELPVVGGSGSGLTTIGFTAEGRGFALGGTIGGDDLRVPSVATTEDGGGTWTAGGLLSKPGPAYGAAAVPGTTGPTLLAVGPGGLDWSADGGRSWSTAASDTWWAVACAAPDACWSVGPRGRITRWSVR